MASNPKAPTPLVVYVSFGEADCPCGIPHAPLYWGSGTEEDPIMLDTEGPPPECPILMNQREKAKRKREEEERERERELRRFRRAIRMHFDATKKGGSNPDAGNSARQ